MTLPNQLSTLRIILTPLFVVAFCIENINATYLAFIIFVIASLTDYYDGILARRYDKTSSWGRFLDPLADKILVSAVLITFAVFGFVKFWMVLTIVLRDAVITGLRGYAMFKGKPIITSYMAKAKTFSQMTIIYIIFVYILLKKTFAVQNLTNPVLDKVDLWNLIHMSMLFVTILTVISGIKYLVENRSHMKSMIRDFYRAFVPSDL